MRSPTHIRLAKRFSPGLGLALAGALFITGMVNTAQARPGLVIGGSVEVEELTQEVAALSLYHQLDLTAAQRAQLAEILGSYHASMEGIDDALQRSERESVRALEAARRDLERAGKITSQTSARMDAARTANIGLRSDTKAVTQPTLQHLSNVLTNEQLQVLQSFQMQDLFGTTKGSASKAHQKVDALRAMTPAQLDKRAARIAERASARGQNGEAKAQAFRSLVAEMQRIPDAQWPAQRGDYSAQLAALRSPTKKGAHGSTTANSNTHRGASHLLNEAFYDALLSG